MSNEKVDSTGFITKIKHGITLPSLVVAAVLLAFVYVHIRAYIVFAGVDIGMSRVALLEQVGQPRRIEKELIFCEPYFPWTGECPPPRSGGEFLYFKFGIDRWIVTGLDRAGIVWCKTLGDT
jgi:hypothetical protein